MKTRSSLGQSLRASVLLIAAVSIPASAVSAQACFESAPAQPVGGMPVALESADLNGDGRPDLIALLNTPQFSISLNTGAGTFQPPTVTTGGFGGMQGVTCADLDGDGDVDLALSAGGLFLAMNQGGATFPAATQLLLAGTITGVTHGDLDADGDIDLVASEANTNEVAVFLNQGAAAFPSVALYPTGARPASPRCADVDGDGDLDLLVADSLSNTVSVFLNAGNGTFGASVSHAVALTPQEIVTVDFDLDGDIDVAVTCALGFSLTVLANQGNGTFTTQFQYTDGQILSVLESGDLNADGWPDLLLANRATILDNLGNGTFGARPLPEAIGSPKYAAVEDFDGDGDVDVVVGASTVEHVVTLFNRNDGTFFLPPAAELTSVPEPAAAASGLARFDFDADGDLDLAVGKAGPAALLVYENLGNGSYQELPGVPLIGKPVRVEAADFDGDGDEDLATITNTPGSATIVLNQGQGTFSTTVTQAQGVGSTLGSLECADFDGDGDIDVVTGTTSPGSLLFKNQGNGTMAIPVSVLTGANLRALESLDFDADGDVDLVSVHASPARLVLHANQGAGTFSVWATIPLASNPLDVRAADIDADGDLDLSVSSLGTSSLSIFWRTGPGVFSPPVSFTMGFAPSILSIADWDGDGDADVLASSSGGLLGLLENQGAGVLTVGSNWVARSPTWFGLAMDFDGDLDLDFLYTDLSSGPVRVLRNCRSPFVSFCAGDGTSTACPCGNLGASGHGCANSTSANGALLGGNGNAFLANDTVVLSASGTLDGPGMFLQSDGPTALPFGDGLLCAGTQIRRLAVVFASGGVSTLPNATIQTPLHVLGDVQFGGVVRHYQLYYRDSNAGFCTPATFNTTNGVTLTWAP